MVSYFKEGLRYIWPFKSKVENEVLKNVPTDPNYSKPIIKFLGPWESSMVTMQSIFIWEHPMKSAFALFMANILYWYFALNNIKFFYGTCVVGWLVLVYHQWVYYIWPEISISPVGDQEDWTPVNPRVLSVPEVGRYVEGSLNFLVEQKQRILQLRKRQPGLFCICVTFWFTVLWVIGRSLSGVQLLYGLMTLTMCGPGVLIHAVPKSVYVQLRNAWSILTGRNLMSDSCSSLIDSEIAEFLPEDSSEDAQTALIIPLMSDTAVEDAEDVIKRMKKKSQSKSYSRKSRTRNVSGISFTAGLSEDDFPSLQGDCSDLEESDLALPEIIPEHHSPQEEINFVQSHFGNNSGSSSSDDDDDKDQEEFTEGLTFRDTIDGRLRRLQGVSVAPQVLPSQSVALLPSTVPTISITQAAVDKLVGSIAAERAASLLTSLGQQLVSAMTTNVPEDRPPNARVSDSHSSEEEEEFELISDDEI